MQSKIPQPTDQTYTRWWFGFAMDEHIVRQFGLEECEDEYPDIRSRLLLDRDGRPVALSATSETLVIDSRTGEWGPWSDES